MVLNFVNLTISGVAPSVGDSIRYEVAGVTYNDVWDWDALMQLIQASGSGLTVEESAKLLSLPSAEETAKEVAYQVIRP